MQLGTRLLTLTIDGEEFTAEVSNCRITTAAADGFVSFADAAAGGKRAYALAGTAVQDPAVGTIWDKVYAHAGESFEGVLAPAGGEDPSPATPHFPISGTIQESDGDFLGGEADASTTARFTFDFEWPLDGKPLRQTA